LPACEDAAPVPREDAGQAQRVGDVAEVAALAPVDGRDMNGGDAEPALGSKEQELGLELVAASGGLDRRDDCGAQRAEAGLRVRHAGAEGARDEGARKPVGEPAARRHERGVAPPCADHEVGPVGEKRRQQGRDLLRRVLAIGVERDDVAGAQRLGAGEAGGEGPALAEVALVARHGGAARVGDPRGVVVGAVVHDQELGSRHGAPGTRQHVLERARGPEGRDHERHLGAAERRLTHRSAARPSRRSGSSSPARARA
jgi:hypothetical protein